MAIAILNGAPTTGNTLATPSAALPLAAPAGMDAANLDLVFGVRSAFTTTPMITLSNDGSAFTTEVAEAADANATVYGEIRIWRKTAAGSPGSINLSPSSSTDYLLGARFGLSGVNLTDPIAAKSASPSEGTLTSGGGATPATLTIASITTPEDGCLVFAWLMLPTYISGEGVFPGGWGGVTATGTGTWTKQVGGTSDGANYRPSLGIWTQPKATAGAVGSLAITLPRYNDNCNWVGGMLAIRPDAAPAPSVVANLIRSASMGL